MTIERHDWKGFAVLLLLVLAVMNWTACTPIILKAAGWQDFSIFYTGARIIWSGHAAQLYDLPTQGSYQTPYYRVHPLPFDHPAYELLLFLPLALLPFNTAIVLWTVLGIALCFGIGRLLTVRLTNLPGPVWLWLAMLSSFPFILTLVKGQDSILLLALFTLTYANLKSHRDMIAGVTLALALFKFAVVLPFVIPFLLFRRWKFLSGFAVGGFLVTGISSAITGIEGARQYIRLLLDLVAHPEVGYIHPEMMPNVRGFWSTFVLGNETLGALIVVSTLFLLLIPLLTFDDGERSERFDLWFGLNLTVALLASPHLLWHDLSVLLLPILLAANVLLKPLPTGISVGFNQNQELMELSVVSVNRSNKRVPQIAIILGFVYACVWPAYFVGQPSYFFPLWCVLIVWFVRQSIRPVDSALEIEYHT